MVRTLSLFAAAALAVSGFATAPSDTSLESGTSDHTAAEYHDSTILVRVDDPLVHDLADVGDVVNTLAGIGVDVVEVPAGTVDVAIAAYNALPGVEFAEPNYVQDLHAGPDDPFFEDQYGLDRIDAVDGWALYDPDGEFAPTGGATIAVIDSGIDLTHPEFDGKIADPLTDCRSFLTGTGTDLPGCQENNVHGTHVSGIAAAITDNGVGIAGVGFDAELMVLQACTMVCFTADTAAAIIYAADNGADVSNMSFGGDTPSNTSEAAVLFAESRGMLQVSSAGNSGPDADSVGYPAGFEHVIAVSATDADDRIADFSSRGPEVDVAAPGASVLSTLPGSALYGELSGTSMSSPHVAGLGALLRSLGLDHAEARDAIIAGADLIDGATGRTDEYGAGRINVANSVAIALGEDDSGNRGRSGDAPGRNR
jgi:subtilisin family serine protease